MHFFYLVAAFHQCTFEKIEQIIFHLFLELSFPLHGITHAEPLQPLLQQILALLWLWPFEDPCMLSIGRLQLLNICTHLPQIIVPSLLQIQ